MNKKISKGLQLIYYKLGTVIRKYNGYITLQIDMLKTFSVYILSQFFSVRNFFETEE